MVNLFITKFIAVKRWLRPKIITHVKVKFGLSKVGVIEETCNLLSWGDLSCWSANSRAYPQLNIVTVCTPMWRWEVNDSEKKCKIASKTANKLPLTLRKTPSLGVQD